MQPQRSPWATVGIVIAALMVAPCLIGAGCFALGSFHVARDAARPPEPAIIRQADFIGVDKETGKAFIRCGRCQGTGRAKRDAFGPLVTCPACMGLTFRLLNDRDYRVAP